MTNKGIGAGSVKPGRHARDLSGRGPAVACARVVDDVPRHVIPIQDGALQIALTLGLPTGSRRKALGAGDVSFEPNFTLSRWLGRMNGQLSFSWRRSGIGGRAAADDDVAYDVALLYPWREWFLTFEGAGETAASETAYYAVPELVWKPGKHLELLVAVPVGLTGAAADYGVIAGITVEIERLTGRGQRAD